MSYCELRMGRPLTDKDKYWDYEDQPSSAGQLFLTQPTPVWNSMVSISYAPPACPFEPCAGVHRCPTIVTNPFAPVSYVRGSLH
jgi:hypothetical protein